MMCEVQEVSHKAKSGHGNVEGGGIWILFVRDVSHNFNGLTIYHQYAKRAI
jgi:hypothetical protein